MNLVRVACALLFLWGPCTATLNAQATAMTYDGTAQSIGYLGSYEDFIVPTDVDKSFLLLTLKGGDGGKSVFPNTDPNKVGEGGKGATMRASFAIGTGATEIPPGSTLRFIVGDKGVSRTVASSESKDAGSGGGGSAVFLKRPDSTNWELLLVAGGGGGGFSSENNGKSDGQGGQITEAGGNNGGTDGQGGLGGVQSGGGGGLFGNGGSYGDIDETGGRYGWQEVSSSDDADATVDPLGGGGGCGSAGCTSSAGFGAGGGGWTKDDNGDSGGGGGGYSGGGGGGNHDGGGGGGSFVCDFALKTVKTPGGTTSNADRGEASYQFFNAISPACVSSYTVELDAESTVTLEGSEIDDGSSCELDITLSVSPSSLNCTDFGTQTVTLTVTDEIGNTATCTSSLTVSDAAANLPYLAPSDDYQTIDHSGGYVDYLIPDNTTQNKLTLKLRGGDGGKKTNDCGATGRGGKGATIETQFNIGNGTDSIPPGSVVRFVVGGKGANRDSPLEEGAGGGGGSGVLYRTLNSCDWHILAVAGGGGGGYSDACADKSNGQGGRKSTSGGDGRSGGGNGGSDGDGGKAGKFAGFEISGGGGGFDSDGGAIKCSSGADWGDGKKGGDTGGEGGSDGSGGCGSGRDGGFGYGGGGLGYGAGGGGGGYSGGGGGGTSGGGGGGGSYINPMRDTSFTEVKKEGSNTASPDHGYISYAMPQLTSTPPVALCKEAIAVTVTPEGTTNISESDVNDGSYDPDDDPLTYSVSPSSFSCANPGLHMVTLTVTDVTALSSTCQTQVAVSLDISSYSDLDTDGDPHSLGATGSYLDYIIPENVEYSQITLAAVGGDGGEHKVNLPVGGCTGRGGKGASILATFNIGCGSNQIPPGSVIRFIVGEKGVGINNVGIEGAGGGGGTGIIYKAPGECDWNILIVAAGGGGGYASGVCDKSDGKPGETGTSGSNGKGNSSGNGGNNGDGGTVGANWAGAGGGAYSNGQEIGCGPGPNWGGGKKGAWEGGEGGQDGTGACGSGRDGGYGFGGGGLGDASGGGGGGYSGGGSGGSGGGGGGGGSYVSPMAVAGSVTFDGGGDTGDPDDGVAAYQFISPQGFDVDQPPTANCKDDIFVELDSDSDDTPTAVVVLATDLNNGSTDDCGTEYLTFQFSTGDYDLEFGCSNAGTNVVTLVVTDLVGHTATCTSTVSVIEDVPPSASCQDITVYLDYTGNGSITPTDVDNGSTDNCGVSSLLLSQTDFVTADTGLQTVSLTVLDANDNSDECNSEVTVIQTFLVEAHCQDVILSLDADGTATLVPGDVDNGSAVLPFGDLSFSLDQTDFNCADIGSSHVVTLTTTDIRSMTSSCTSTITVQDTTPPVALCKDITVSLDANGKATLLATEADNGSSDGCGIESIKLGSFSQLTFTCASLNANSYLLKVTDIYNNTGTCTGSLTVTDTFPPEATCKNVTVNLDETGNGNLAASQVNNGSTDNCTAVNSLSLDLDLTDFTCDDLGQSVVTLTVTDDFNNTSTCTATVNVQTVHCCSGSLTRVYVDQNAAPNGDGSTWASAYQSLQDGLLRAAGCIDVEEIWVAAGTYYPDEGVGITDNDRHVNFSFPPHDLALYGGFTGTETDLSERVDWESNATILSGDLLQDDGPNFGNNSDNSRTVIFASGAGITSSSRIDGFTITGANNNLGGGVAGGMLITEQASPTITNCRIVFNSATSRGGGICVQNNALPAIENCQIIGNTTSNVGGGGIYCSTDIQISDCFISGNNAGARRGGGIFIASASPVLTRCTIIENKAHFNTGLGGGVFASFGNPVFNACLIAGNFSGDNGGGIHLNNADAQFTNCVVLGNKASNSEGGGLYNTGGSPTLLHCSFSGNTANTGGAIRNVNSSSPVITNSIFWGDNTEIENDAGSAATVDHCIVQGGYPGGTNILDTDPLFIDQPDYADAEDTVGNLRLQPCSPAVDAGTDAGVTDDLDGNMRPVNLTADMGAFESQEACAVSILGTILWENDGVSGVGSANVALSGDESSSTQTATDGSYVLSFTEGYNFTVKPTKNINKLNGVTVADALAIQQHVAGNVPITSPYKQVAADVNKSNSITGFDATIINQSLLGNPSALNQFKTSWRFVPVSYAMSVPPWGFPEKINLAGLSGNTPDQDFWGIKTGDVVDVYADPANMVQPPPLVLRASDRVLQAG
ncbi:MAG: hypothetical protein KDC70_05360, partial [Saprospiraceae bacterium]|nr:hypothetical protein [Saprospiraceae bacterium]